MMSYVIMTVMVLACAVAQLMTPAWAILGQVKFPFLLSLVLYYALNRDLIMALAAGFLAGFVQDVLSPLPLGTSPALFGLIAWVASLCRGLILTDSPVTQVFFGAVAAIAVTLGTAVVIAEKGLLPFAPLRVLLRTVGAAGLGAVCAPAVFRVTGWLDGLVGNVAVEEPMHDFD